MLIQETSESLGLTDTISVKKTVTVTIADDLGLSDAVIAAFVITIVTAIPNGTTWSGSTDRVWTSHGTLSLAGVIPDGTTWIGTTGRVWTSHGILGLVAYDLLSIITVTITDDLGLSDAADRITITARTVTESLALTDTVSYALASSGGETWGMIPMMIPT